MIDQRVTSISAMLCSAKLGEVAQDVGSSFARGKMKTSSAVIVREIDVDRARHEAAHLREAIITLVRQGWGRTDAAYRQVVTATFMPGATAEELDWFNSFQRQTVTPENAARSLEVFADIDVRAILGDVRAPTLVMHARGDRRIPLTTGGELAAEIPGAEFVTLDSDNHLLLGREPASLVRSAYTAVPVDRSSDRPKLILPRLSSLNDFLRTAAS